MATGGKASTLANFPPPMAIGGPPMATDAFPWVVSTGIAYLNNSVLIDTKDSAFFLIQKILDQNNSVGSGDHRKSAIEKKFKYSILSYSIFEKNSKFN